MRFPIRNPAGNWKYGPGMKCQTFRHLPHGEMKVETVGMKIPDGDNSERWTRAYP